MTQPIGKSSTVTSWHHPALYAKRNGIIAATALRALGLSIINRNHIETWSEVVNDEVICYSMSRLDITKNFGWVLFDKIVNKNKTLPDSTPASTEKTAVDEEDPFAYLLLLPYTDSDKAPPKRPFRTKEDDTLFSVYDLYVDDIDEPKVPSKQTFEEKDDVAFYLALGAQEHRPNKRTEFSDEEFVSAFAYYADASRQEASGPVAPKAVKENEVDNTLLELLSL